MASPGHNELMWSKPGLWSTFTIAVLYTISCYTLPRYPSIHLYEALVGFHHYHTPRYGRQADTNYTQALIIQPYTQIHKPVISRQSQIGLDCSHTLYGIINWKHFPSYCPFVWGIHQWLVDSPHKRTDRHRHTRQWVIRDSHTPKSRHTPQCFCYNSISIVKTESQEADLYTL